MTDERITETRTTDGDTHTTHTTVISEKPRGGGIGWLIAILLILAIGVGIWAFSTMGTAEMAKDDAVADAANEVGDAAEQVGDAAQEAAENLTN